MSDPPSRTLRRRLDDHPRRRACSSPSASSPARSRRRSHWPTAARVLNFCANNYLGLADHPGRHRGGQGRAGHARLRHGVGALHLRHPGPAQAAGGRRSPTSSAPRTPSSTPPASTPTAACSNRCWARTTRSSPTRSTTPRSSTACACARPSASATPTATWPTWRRSCRQADAAGARDQADHHRRRVLDGRLHRAARRDHRAGEEVRRAGAHRRMPRHRLPRRDRPRLGRGQGRAGPDRHHHRHAGQGDGRRAGRLHHRRSAEVIELLRQRSRPYLFSNSLPPHVVAAGIKAFDMLASAGDLRDQLAENTALLPRAHDGRRLRHQARRAPDRAR